MFQKTTKPSGPAALADQKDREHRIQEEHRREDDVPHHGEHRTSAYQRGSWTLAGLAEWLADYARPERDEALFVLEDQGAVVDVALGVTWRPAGAWRCLGSLDEVTGDVEAWLRAALGGR